MTQNPIFYALDFSSLQKAKEMSLLLKNYIGGLKIGLRFFVANGMSGVLEIAKFGLPIFLDLKLYDIPNTVGQTIREISKINEITMTTVHISGGPNMLCAALEERFNNKLKILGITILTSNLGNNNVFANLNNLQEDSSMVVNMAYIAKDVGLHGVVCSGLETQMVRSTCGNDFLIVNPGIRMKNDNAGDQKRVVEPKFAIQNGADILVIGRTITNSKDPIQTVQKILESLN